MQSVQQRFCKLCQMRYLKQCRGQKMERQISRVQPDPHVPWGSEIDSKRLQIVCSWYELQYVTTGHAFILKFLSDLWYQYLFIYCLNSQRYTYTSHLQHRTNLLYCTDAANHQLPCYKLCSYLITDIHHLLVRMLWWPNMDWNEYVWFYPNNSRQLQGRAINLLDMHSTINWKVLCSVCQHFYR